MSIRVYRSLLRHLKRNYCDIYLCQNYMNYYRTLRCSSYSNPAFVDNKQLKEFPNSFHIKTKGDKDIIPSGDSDTFGTLSKELKFVEKIDSMPDEDDDVITKNFVDEKTGKTRLSIKQYADLIKKNLADKRLVNALDVLEVKMLQEDRARPDNYIYNLLIDGCAKVGFTKKAFKLYNDMKKRGLKVTGATYTSLFNSCALSPVTGDGLKRAHHLRDLITEKQILLNRSNYHSMMKAFGRCGDIATVFNIVDEMVSKGVPLTSETFCFLLQACVSDQKNGFRHALMVWQKMREKRVKPTLYCYNLILRCARDCHIGNPLIFTEDLKLITSQNKKVEEQKLLSDGSGENLSCLPATIEETNLPSAPILPNMLSENPSMGSVVSVMEIVKPKHRLMLLGGVSGLTAQMKSESVVPDIKTASLLLDLIPSTNQAEHELLKRMEKLNIPLDIDFCNMLIRKRCLRHDYISSREVLNLITGHRLIPNLLTFGVLSLTCRNTEDTLEFLRNLDDAGFRPNIEILGGLVCAARHSWNSHIIMMIMDMVMKEDMKVSLTFIKHLNGFKEHVSNQIRMKDQGLEYHDIINNQSFLEDYNKFVVKLKMFLKLVETDEKDRIHPWSQYRKKKMAGDS